MTSLPSVHTRYYKLWILTVTKSLKLSPRALFGVLSLTAWKKGKTVCQSFQKAICHATHFPSVAHENSSLLTPLSLPYLFSSHTMSCNPCKRKFICIIWIKLICYPGVHTKSAIFVKTVESVEIRIQHFFTGSIGVKNEAYSKSGLRQSCLQHKGLQLHHFSQGQFRLFLSERSVLHSQQRSYWMWEGQDQRLPGTDLMKWPAQKKTSTQA